MCLYIKPPNAIIPFLNTQKNNMETTKFKISSKYKLLNAIGFFAILLAFLSIYYIINNNTEEIPAKALTWGIPILLLYYTFILRMKIEIAENDLLICKRENDIFATTIDIQQINQIEIKKSFLLSKVVVHYNGNKKLELYPADCTLLVDSLKKR